jgi:glycosyltransferase involved in cell wall biosynthesis
MTMSLVIPTYNRSKLLQETLTSLERQSLPTTEFEVVVVDDGSSDNSYEVVKSFGTCLDIQYIFQEDKGFRAAAARNLGIAASKYDICVFVDCGILLHSQALEFHSVAHASSTKSLAVNGYTFGFEQHDLHGNDLTMRVDTKDVDGSIARLTEDRIFHDIREPIYARVHDDLMALPAPWAIFWSCHTSTPRRALLNVGLFDPAFNSWGAEDDDLAYRLQKAGVTFTLSRNAMALHVPHGKDEDVNKQSGIKNLEYMYSKYRDEIIRNRIESGWDGVNMTN